MPSFIKILLKIHLSTYLFNPFPNNRFWTLPIRKSLQTTILILVEMAENSPKRRNWLLRAISPIPTLFSKELYCRHVKTRACLGKG